MTEATYKMRQVATLSVPPVSEVVLEWEPTLKKAITKRYQDGRILSLLVENDVLTQKSMTFKWPWDIERLKEEVSGGGEIKFQYWNGGGIDVALTWFGSYLLSMFPTF